MINSGDIVRVTSHSNKAVRTIIGVGQVLKKIGDVENYYEVKLLGPYVENNLQYLIGSVGDIVKAMIYPEDLIEAAVPQNIDLEKVSQVLMEEEAKIRRQQFVVIQGGKK